MPEIPVSGHRPRRGRRAARLGTSLAVLVVVAAASATVGWFVGDRGAETRRDSPRASAAPSDPDTPTTSSGAVQTVGSALTSVTAKTVVQQALARLAPDSDFQARLPADIDAAAVEVTVTDARSAGAVSLDAGAGPVDAVRIAEPGTTTSNLVVLPVSGRSLDVRHGPGGGLTVRIVGTFGSAGDTGAGRFVAHPPVRVAHLDTAQDGRELTVPARAYGARPGIRAALVLVTAEVGEVPARLLVGRQPEGVAERMVWGGAKDSHTQRRGLALVPVNAQGEFSMRYEHGTALDVDVLGWFTGPGQSLDQGALLVPAAAQTLYDGQVDRGGTTLDVPGDATGALLNLAADPGVSGDLGPDDVAVASGRTLAVVVDADSGEVHLKARRALGVRVDLMGVFVEAP